MSTSPSSGCSSTGTSRPARAISAVSRVRENCVCAQRSSGTCAICCPSSRASSRPFSVRWTGTPGSPLTRFSKFSVDSPWRAITKSCTRPTVELLWSNGAVSAQVEELPDNKVRLTVDVPSADVHHAVEHAASDLAASAKIPGFRKGKVPMPVLVSRIGKERLYTEAIESHIGAWYGNAVARAGIRPADRPELEYELPTSDEQDWRFTPTVPPLAQPPPAPRTTLQGPS